MTGLVIVIVVIAAVVFWLLRHESRPAPRLGSGAIGDFFGIPVIQSPYVPKGTILLMDASALDLGIIGPPVLKERLTHDELWWRLSTPVVNDPKAFVIRVS